MPRTKVPGDEPRKRDSVKESEDKIKDLRQQLEIEEAERARRVEERARNAKKAADDAKLASEAEERGVHADLEDGCTPFVPTGQCCGRSIRLSLMVACVVVSLVGLVSISVLANDGNFAGDYDKFSDDELVGVRVFLIVVTALVSATAMAAWYGVVTYNTRVVRPFLYLCAADLFAKFVIWVVTLAKTAAICDHAYTRLCADPPDGVQPLNNCASQGQDAWKSSCKDNVTWTTVGMALLQTVLAYWYIHALWSYCRLVELKILTPEDPNGVWWGLSGDMSRSNNRMRDEHFYDD